MILHAPSLLLMTGYAVFWIELYAAPSPQGRTSPLGLVVFSFLMLFVAWRGRGLVGPFLQRARSEWREASRFDRIYFAAALAGAAAVFILAAWASRLPPHMPPEYDAINYHYTLPRQHLIRGGFSHIPWSTADLWPLPIQFALSPFWFLTELPNKWPQLLFLGALWGLVVRLAFRLLPPGQRLAGGLTALLALVASHGFAVQYGKAMLDIAACYLIIACLDSWLAGRYWLAAAELAFYTWSKSYTPFQMAALAAALGLLYWLGKRRGWTAEWAFSSARPYFLPAPKRIAAFFFLASLAVGLPFCAKSFYYSGTPLFPFAYGVLPPIADGMKDRRPALEASAKSLLNNRNAYGGERNIRGFVTHFWRVAIPNKGVNNEFDYPIGLPYLVLFPPFLFFLARGLKRKAMPLLPMAVLLLWFSWWMGSRQSRWLYIPLTLMFLSVAGEKAVLRSWGVRAALLISLALTGLSGVRENRPDWRKTAREALRPQDERLVQMGAGLADARSPVPLPDKEAAFAAFPVHVTAGSSDWVLPGP